MIKKISGLIIFSMLVASCSPALPPVATAVQLATAIINTPIPASASPSAVPPAPTSVVAPSATPLSITPDTAFDIAWAAFENAASYTAVGTDRFQGPSEPLVDEISCQVDVANLLALLIIDSSMKFINNGRMGTYYTKDGIYKADATGVYKLVENLKGNLPCQPGIDILKLTAADLKSSPSSYVGEVSTADGNLYQYQIDLPDAKLSKNPDASVDEKPEINLYVDSQTGFPAKLTVSIARLWLNSVYFDQYETTRNYTDWNITEIPTPEVARSGDTTFQTYTGQHANIFTFQIPVTNLLNEFENGNIDLETPAGDHLTWSTYPSWTLDVPDKDDAFKNTVCNSYATVMVLPSIKKSHPEADLEQAAWIKPATIGFCKIKLILSNKHQILYVFNAPVGSVAQNLNMQKKLERATFMILVTSENDQDLDAAFKEVLQSIEFVK